MKRWRCGRALRMNVCARRSFRGSKRFRAPHLAITIRRAIILGPSLAIHGPSLRDAREHGWSREPIVEMLIPSTLDDSLAPPGAHVASLFCQHVAPELPDGRSWDDHREEVADLMIETVERTHPASRRASSAVRRSVRSTSSGPSGSSAATSFTGRCPSTSFSRPVRCSATRTIARPSKGLYHCGAGAHPGGGVTGAPGHNAAQAIAADLKSRFRRWRA